MNNGHQKFWNEKGFTLIEILIALFLGSLLLVVVISGIKGFSAHDKMKEEMDQLERAVRFVKDEAVLRNTVVRLRLFLNKEPQQYTVEFGPDGNFVIPKFILQDEDKLSLSDKEKMEKDVKRFNSKFSKVDEYAEEAREFHDRVKLVGVATLSAKKLITEGEAAIYAFPNGEIDDALIVLATDQEVGAIKIPSLQPGIDQEMELFENNDADLIDAQQKKAREVYEQWLK
ncbi:MAG: hypothetical protein COW00_03650 [Bdellovibrio sp. CG12_big_fil_rev_8_21_14_0_65_39_13]|nr:MAG: hypothetical protein COW78_14785 [Bdellovibrio sp. CG22_combo_CG10-13_8_21_14_all_39_27]PIQ61457.1 MAG: hypothetical protein COW00_03650 [Bdellovibrio sp. CG12_big_fil_rev_8_21_14_0_65_39_13]PIR35303.1 MAG: hypothetical protein COV37_09415 [Bdellovibrio sp. CG11_big_fil_rev_8_21_14_0_20_39_38]